MEKSNKASHNHHKWDKVFKNGPSKICGRQLLPYADRITSDFLKAVFHKFYSVHS